MVNVCTNMNKIYRKVCTLKMGDMEFLYDHTDGCR